MKRNPYEKEEEQVACASPAFCRVAPGPTPGPGDGGKDGGQTGPTANPDQPESPDKPNFDSVFIQLVEGDASNVGKDAMFADA